MGSSLNFLIGSDLAGVLEDEEDVDAEAAGCLALLASILVDAVCFQWPKACRMSFDSITKREGRLFFSLGKAKDDLQVVQGSF
jgi:hypothetical protein